MNHLECRKGKKKRCNKIDQYDSLEQIVNEYIYMYIRNKNAFHFEKLIASIVIRIPSISILPV